MNRTPIRQQSKRRQRENREHAPIRAAVFARDRHCRLAQAGGCFGTLGPHHLRKASAGGPYEPCNLLALCDAHNSAVEDAPAWAYQLGLVCRHGDTLAECWERMASAGLVDYDCDGVSLAPNPSLSYSALDVHDRSGQR